MEIFSLFGTIAVKYADAVNQIDTVIHSADTADGSLGDMEESAEDADSAVGSLGDSAEKADGKFSVWGATLANLAANAIQKVIDKCTELAKSVVTLGRDFTGTMSEVEAISGASAEDMQMLEETARHFGATTKFSANEAAEALKYMSMAGWDAEKQAAALGGVLDLAASSGEDLGTTSDIVTDAMTALGLEAEKASNFADILAAASSNANTNVGILGESFKYCAPIVGSMSDNEERAIENTKDLAVNLGLMANAGIKGSAAGNSMKNALVNLVKPTKQQAEAMQALGLMTTETVSRLDEEAISKAQSKVADKTGDLEKKQIAYNQAVEKYGEASAQAKTKLVDLEKAERNLSDAQDELTAAQQTTIEEVVGVQNAFTDEHGKMKSLGEITKILRSTLGGLNVELTDEEGNVREVDDVIADLSQTEEGLTQAQQLQNAAILFGKQNLSGMMAVINASEEDYNKLTEAIYGSENAASDMAKTMNNNLQGDMASMGSAWEELGLKIYDSIERPLRSMVQAVTGSLIPALTYVLQGKDGAENVLSSALQTLVNKLGVHIRNIAGRVTDAVSVIVSGILKSLPSLIPAVTKIFTTITDTLSQNIPMILQAVSDFIQKFAGRFAENLPVVIESALNLITALADGLLQALPELLEKLPDLVQKIADGLLQSIDLIIQTGVTLFVALVDAMPEIISGIVNVLPALITGIVGGLLSRLPDLIQAGITLFVALVDNLPEIISAITEVLPDIITAIVSAILENLPAIIDAGFQLFSALIGALPEIIATVAGAVPEIVEGILGALPEIAEKFGEFLQNIGNLAPVLMGVVTAFLSFKAITGISGLIQNAGMIFLDLENIFYYFIDVILPAIPALLSKVSGAFTGLFSVIAANPVAAVIAVIAGLAVAIITLWNTNENFRNAVIGIWESIQETLFKFFDNWVSGFETIKEFLSGIISAVGGFFSDVWNFFVGYGEYLADWMQKIHDTAVSVFTAIRDFIATIFTAVHDFFATIFNAIYTTISTIINTIYTTIVNVWTAIYDTIKPLLDALAYLFETVFEAVKILTGSAMDWISEKISAIWNAIVAFITPILEGIKNTFETAWNSICDAISAVLDAIHNVITTVWTTVSGFISDVLNTIWNFIVTAWNNYVNTITTVLNAIWSVVSTVWNTISGFISQILNAVFTVVSNIWNSISTAISNVLNAIFNVVSSIWNNIKTTIENVMNVIKTTVSNIWESIKSGISTTITGIKDTIVNGFNVAVDFVKNLAGEAWQWGADIIDNIVNGIRNCIGNVADAVTDVADTIREFLHFSVPDKGPLTDFESWMPDFINGLADGIQNNQVKIGNAVDSLADFIKNRMLSLISSVQKIFSSIRNFIRFDNILNLIQNAFAEIEKLIFNAGTDNNSQIIKYLDFIQNAVIITITQIHDFLVRIWSAVIRLTDGDMTAIQDIITDVLYAVRTVFLTVWNGILNSVDKILDALRNLIGEDFETVRNLISEYLTSAKNIVISVFDTVRNVIADRIASAVETVRNGIDRIRSFFNFSWELPELKLPHFNISGEFSLDPLSVPTFGIDWYAKGGIMTEPTVFGYNPSTNNLQVGGEAGAEAVAPIDTLLTYVRSAVKEENQALAEKVETIIILLNDFFPALLRAIPKEVVLDTGETVGGLASRINEELGNISSDEERWRI